MGTEVGLSRKVFFGLAGAALPRITPASFDLHFVAAGAHFTPEYHAALRRVIADRADCDYAVQTLVCDIVPGYLRPSLTLAPGFFPAAIHPILNDWLAVNIGQPHPLRVVALRRGEFGFDAVTRADVNELCRRLRS